MRTRKLLVAIAAAAVMLALPASGRAGLIGYWRFDNASQRGADSSGNGLTGAFVGAPSYAAGKSGGALSFDGGDDGMYLPSFPSGLTVREVSVSCWVNVPSTGFGAWDDWWELTAGGWIVAEIAGNNAIATNGTPEIYTNTGVGFIEFPGPPDLRGAGWHLLTATASASANELKLYVDGSLWHSGTWAGSAALTGFSVGYGRTRNGRYINSVIDEVQLYDYALPAEQVHYLLENPSKAIPEPASIALLAAGLAALARRRRRSA